MTASRANRGTSKTAACVRLTSPDWESSSIAQRLPNTTSIFASRVRRAGTNTHERAALYDERTDLRESYENLGCNSVRALVGVHVWRRICAKLSGQGRENRGSARDRQRLGCDDANRRPETQR